ncbi:hypothetical protein KEM60_00503 [Austwickia sp. TVS 96-490-7B]|uniref:hypothetical protein n=1 Tax=Austwickia sp. TVS 96-490-7B TaxID=2830843 RepID=UPI001C56551B|nr:hypothetical protein [Austwickia sp. TVS 96-490-7B]MBW3084316.1 hypothetical protein [Austwickia sp. TVS 96-490-7B]
MDRSFGATYALAALSVLGLASCGGEPAAEPSTPSPTASVTPKPADAPVSSTTSTSARPSIEPGTIPGTGTFAVGTDIQPGTYVSDTPAGTTCYIARLGKKDSPDPLIANKVNKGRTEITIEKTDSFVESRDCATWKKR